MVDILVDIFDFLLGSPAVIGALAERGSAIFRLRHGETIRDK